MLPISFDLAKYPTVDTIRLLASLLERMTIANDLLNKQQSQPQPRRASLQPQQPPQQPQQPQQQTPAYTRFHARLVPSIDIYSYLSRILKYCPCANECFLSLLVYFDRMSKNSIALTGKPFTIDSFNIHRLIIAGVMVSSKFFSDVFYTNTRYAKVGGLPVTELNCLELEFLKLNNFNLTVQISELQKYGDHLLKVGYLTQEMRKAPLFRHSRSNSLDQQTRIIVNVDGVCDLTQRMSFDEQKYYYQQPVVRRMTSTNSLKENNRYSYQQQQQQQQQQLQQKQYEQQPRHSRSSVNLNQGFWKPLDEASSTSSSSLSLGGGGNSSSRRLSSTSIHAPPFIPSSELQQQVQQVHHHGSVYYYPPIGIPTPPPSASPQQSYPTMYL